MPRLITAIVAAVLALSGAVAAEEASQAERAYQRGAKALDERQWEKAIEAFRQVPKDSPRADGAVYLRALAASKLGRHAEALADLAAFQTTFPSSRLLSQAKALEIEVRHAAGQPVQPGARRKPLG